MISVHDMTWLLLAGAILIPGTIVYGDGLEEKKPEKTAMEELSVEERKRVREAFKVIFKEPQIVEARKQLRQANKAYKIALREAVARLEPELSAKMSEMLDSRARENVWALRVPIAFPLPNPEDVPEELRAALVQFRVDVTEDEQAQLLISKLNKTPKGKEKNKVRKALSERLSELVKSKAPPLMDYFHQLVKERRKKRKAKAAARENRSE